MLYNPQRPHKIYGVRLRILERQQGLVIEIEKWVWIGMDHMNIKKLKMSHADYCYLFQVYLDTSDVIY